jgi:hypothetical protein
MPTRVKSLFFFGFFLIFFSEVSAQCAMCRAVLESGSDTSAAEGINNGIVYLMAIPYILVGVVFYAVYKKLRPTKHP